MTKNILAQPIGAFWIVPVSTVIQIGAIHHLWHQPLSAGSDRVALLISWIVIWIAFSVVLMLLVSSRSRSRRAPLYEIAFVSASPTAALVTIATVFAAVSHQTVFWFIDPFPGRDSALWPELMEAYISVSIGILVAFALSLWGLVLGFQRLVVCLVAAAIAVSLLALAVPGVEDTSSQGDRRSNYLDGPDLAIYVEDGKARVSVAYGGTALNAQELSRFTYRSGKVIKVASWGDQPWSVPRWRYPPVTEPGKWLAIHVEASPGTRFVVTSSINAIDHSIVDDKTHYGVSSDVPRERCLPEDIARSIGLYDERFFITAVGSGNVHIRLREKYWSGYGDANWVRTPRIAIAPETPRPALIRNTECRHAGSNDFEGFWEGHIEDFSAQIANEAPLLMTLVDSRPDLPNVSELRWHHAESQSLVIKTSRTQMRASMYLAAASALLGAAAALLLSGGPTRDERSAANSGTRELPAERKK